MRANRLLYIDNLRIFIISLVVLHHLAVTYGGPAPGGWYYQEGQVGSITSIVMTLFVATNQSFFMGLLFFISAYFTNSSFNNKGIKPFLTRRMIRLGIPLVFFYFILSPITNYLPILYKPNIDMSFGEFINNHRGFGFGPLWFVETLLLFTLIYAVFRIFVPSKFIDANQPHKKPNDLIIIIFTLVLGLLTFIIRIWLPVGYSLEAFGFQVAHFAQYISLLVLGVIAHENHWLKFLNFKNSLRWFLFAQFMIFIIFPTIFYLGGAASGNIAPFLGGWHLQSFSYSLWEQFTGIPLIIGILGLFQHKLNKRNKINVSLAKCTYTVYIIHPPVLVLMCLSLKNFKVNLLIKFLILSIPVIASCFVLAYLIRKLPIVKKVL